MVNFKLKLKNAWSSDGLTYVKTQNKEIYDKIVNNNKVPKNTCLVLIDDDEFNVLDFKLNCNKIKDLHIDHSNHYCVGACLVCHKNHEAILIHHKRMTWLQDIDPSEFGLEADYSAVQDIKNFDESEPYAITVDSDSLEKYKYSDITVTNNNCITYNSSDFNNATITTIPKVEELENKVKELEKKLEKYQSKETQFNDKGEVIW